MLAIRRGMVQGTTCWGQYNLLVVVLSTISRKTAQLVPKLPRAGCRHGTWNGCACPAVFSVPTSKYSPGIIFLPCLSVSAHYFKRRRSLAMGIIISGDSPIAPISYHLNSDQGARLGRLSTQSWSTTYSMERRVSLGVFALSPSSISDCSSRQTPS